MFAEDCNRSQSPDRQVSDAQITTQIKSKLASDVSASSLTNIDVNTTKGVVTLAGQVENTEMNRSAETIAASVPGVLRVNNDLEGASAAASVARCPKRGRRGMEPSVPLRHRASQRVRVSPAALPRWWRCLSSSSASSPRRRALPHRRQPQTPRLGRVG